MVPITLGSGTHLVSNYLLLLRCHFVIHWIVLRWRNWFIGVHVLESVVTVASNFKHYKSLLSTNLVGNDYAMHESIRFPLASETELFNSHINIRVINNPVSPVIPSLVSLVTVPLPHDLFKLLLSPQLVNHLFFPFGFPVCARSVSASRYWCLRCIHCINWK